MGPLQTQIGHRHAMRRVLLRGVTVADFKLMLPFGRGAARTGAIAVVSTRTGSKPWWAYGSQANG